MGDSSSTEFRACYKADVAAKKRQEPFSPYVSDWGVFGPLRLRAQTVAEGVYAGMHRSVRKGAGVEFGGQRPYVFGDDLRFVDKRSLLRHGRLMIREFETETNRALWLVVDATASMAFKGKGPGSKYPFAALCAAAMARIALASGDPVGLLVIGGDGTRALPASAGREAFERIVWTLAGTEPTGDWTDRGREVGHSFAPIHTRARRGSTVVLFSDLIDLPEATAQELGSIATRGRRAFALQVLSPDEIDLPFEHHARFEAMEGGVVVDADPVVARQSYKARLAELREGWSRDLVARGGALITASTVDKPVAVVRSLLLAVRGAIA